MTYGIKGHPHLPAAVQHFGPWMTLQLGQEFTLQFPELPPAPMPVHLSPIFVKPERQSKTH